MSQLSHIGNDGWSVIAGKLDEWKVESVLLVTGKGSYTGSGAEAALAPALEGRTVRRVSDFETNPRAGDIRRILTELGEVRDYGVILAVGGGSVMDVAKLLKAFWTSPDPVTAHLRGEEALDPGALPLIAVPSSAGSGSEATHFAVVYQGKEKFSVADESLRPEMAVVIPSLLASLPTSTAAASGMDALCQGIESYWSIYSTEASRSLAGEAITLAWSSLRSAVLNKDPAALEQIARASHMAGRAIDITKTTAPHAVSYALTSFFGVPHGHAVGLLVPQFLSYNASVTEDDCLDPRGSVWVRRILDELAGMLGCEDVESAGAALVDMMNDLGLETNLASLGVKGDEDLEVIVQNGFNPQRVNNNPRLVTKEGLAGLLQKI